MQVQQEADDGNRMREALTNLDRQLGHAGGDVRAFVSGHALALTPDQWAEARELIGAAEHFSFKLREFDELVAGDE